jgi:hypothetical protein
MSDALSTVVYEMVEGAPLPVKTIAEKVNKRYSTLVRELDPEDQGAKLGVDMLLPLMKVCNSSAPLRFLAHKMGYRLSSARKVAPDKPSFHEELIDTYQALVEYHRAMMEGKPLEYILQCRETLIRQLKEDFVAFTMRREEAEEGDATGGEERREGAEGSE